MLVYEVALLLEQIRRKGSRENILYSRRRDGREAEGGGLLITAVGAWERRLDLVARQCAIGMHGK